MSDAATDSHGAGEAAAVAAGPHGEGKRPRRDVVLRYGDATYDLFCESAGAAAAGERRELLLGGMADELYSSPVVDLAAALRAQLHVANDVTLEFPALNLVFTFNLVFGQQVYLMHLEHFLDVVEAGEQQQEGELRPLEIVMTEQPYCFEEQYNYLLELSNETAGEEEEEGGAMADEEQPPADAEAQGEELEEAQQEQEQEHQPQEQAAGEDAEVEGQDQEAGRLDAEGNAAQQDGEGEQDQQEACEGMEGATHGIVEHQEGEGEGEAQGEAGEHGQVAQPEPTDAAQVGYDGDEQEQAQEGQVREDGAMEPEPEAEAEVAAEEHADTEAAGDMEGKSECEGENDDVEGNSVRSKRQRADNGEDEATVDQTHEGNAQDKEETLASKRPRTGDAGAAATADESVTPAEAEAMPETEAEAESGDFQPDASEQEGEELQEPHENTEAGAGVDNSAGRAEAELAEENAGAAASGDASMI